MIVRELIMLLNRYPKDKEVKVLDNYHASEEDIDKICISELTDNIVIEGDY